MPTVPISRFPFLLDSPINYLKEVGGLSHINTIDDLFAEYGDLIKLALEEVITGENKVQRKLSREEEIIYSHSVVLIASLLNNPRFSSKAALHLSKRYSKELLKLGVQEIINIANLVGIPLRDESSNPHTVFLEERYSKKKVEAVKKYYSLSLGFTEFIKLTRRLRGDPKYRLTNHLLIDGKVYLALDDVGLIARLIEERFYEYILEKIESLTSNEETVRLLENERVLEVISYVKTVEPRHEILAGKRHFGPIRYEAFPPCMARIFESLKNGENLSHHQRFSITSFLGNIGMDKEEIIELFRALPDFKEKVTRYQVEHILGEKGGGKKYLPYSCEKMRAIGLCVADCNVKNPLQYYYLKLRRKNDSQGRDNA